MKTIAFVPLRGGSKSIPEKNIKEISGKPLAFWSIEAALKCSLIDKVFVSTDSKKIRETIFQIKNNKLKVVARSKKTATDNASTESAMLEFARKRNDFQHIVLIQATSPLLTSKDLTGGINKFFRGKYDSLLSVTRQKRFLWKKKDNTAKPLNYNPLRRPRRQELNGFLVENGAFYITFRKNLLKSKCRLSGRVGYYEMPEETYYEVDEPSDWLIVENLLLQRKNKTIKEKVKNIKMAIFDVDGVFTDGSVYLDKNGKETLRFSRIDGKGIELLRKKGYILAVISSEESEIARKRMRKLQIKEVHLGIKDKLTQYKKLKEKYNLKDEEICFCGDDIQDIPVLKKASLSCCPLNALDEVKNVCNFVSRLQEGKGFVRDVADRLI